MKSLKKIRESKGVTYRDMLNGGVEPPSVASIDKEENVTVKVLDKYLAVLGVDGVYDHIKKNNS